MCLCSWAQVAGFVFAAKLALRTAGDSSSFNASCSGLSVQCCCDKLSELYFQELF